MTWKSPRQDITHLASDLGRARQKCLSVPYGELAYVTAWQADAGVLQMSNLNEFLVAVQCGQFATAAGD